MYDSRIKYIIIIIIIIIIIVHYVAPTVGKAGGWHLTGMPSCKGSSMSRQLNLCEIKIVTLNRKFNCINYLVLLELYTLLYQFTLCCTRFGTHYQQ